MGKYQTRVEKDIAFVFVFVFCGGSVGYFLFRLTIIAQDGWPAAKDLAEITRESDEAANLTVVFEETETDKKGKAKTKRISKKYRNEVIAPELIAHCYFSDGLAKLEEKQNELERLSQELESHLEEHGGEEGALNDVLDAKGKGLY